MLTIITKCVFNDGAVFYPLLRVEHVFQLYSFVYYDDDDVWLLSYAFYDHQHLVSLTRYQKVCKLRYDRWKGEEHCSLANEHWEMNQNELKNGRSGLVFALHHRIHVEFFY